MSRNSSDDQKFAWNEGYCLNFPKCTNEAPEKKEGSTDRFLYCDECRRKIRLRLPNP